MTFGLIRSNIELSGTLHGRDFFTADAVNSGSRGSVMDGQA